MTHLILPSGTTDADRFARELAILRGPEVTAADGTVVATDFRALGGALAGVRSTVLRAIAQAHPSSASDLLDELEEQVGLANGGDLSTAARRTRLRAKVRARRQGTELAIREAVRTIASAATLQGVAWSATTAYPRATFRVAIVLPVATFDSGDRATIQALAEQQAPAHTEPRTTTRVGFRCDDPLSRCDDTLLAL